MLKLISGFLLLTALSPAYAELSLRIPLEDGKGGMLPNGTINIVSNSTPSVPSQPETPKIDCQYSKTTGAVKTISYVPVSSGTSYNTSINWQPDTSQLIRGQALKEYYDFNGYRYTFGPFHEMSGSSSVYSICRQAI